MKVKASKARTHLLRWITLAHGGKDITITKHGMPVARLLPLEKAAATVTIKTRKSAPPKSR
jgi:prevent-host-death family protein